MKEAHFCVRPPGCSSPRTPGCLGLDEGGPPCGGSGVIFTKPNDPENHRRAGFSISGRGELKGRKKEQKQK